MAVARAHKPDLSSIQRFSVECVCGTVACCAELIVQSISCSCASHLSERWDNAMYCKQICPILTYGKKMLYTLWQFGIIKGSLKDFRAFLHLSRKGADARAPARAHAPIAILAGLPSLLLRRSAAAAPASYTI